MLIGALIAVAAGSAAHADEPASVAVTTQAARQGTLPHIVTGYGTATPALDATTTLSIQAAGQVRHFEITPGTAVKRGQALLEFTLSPAAMAALTQARSALQLARDQQQHTAQLLAQQLATRDQLAQADKALADAQSTLQALHQQQADRAQTILKAPYDGVVTLIAATQGDLLAPGAPLLTIARSNGVVVDAGVEPAQREFIQPGASVTLSPLGAGQALQGKVTRVADAINPRSRLVDVEVSTAAPLMAGTAFKADIAAGAWRGWLIPRDAVIGNDDGWRVFQVDHGKAVAVAVTILGESATTTVVSGALVADRPLVIDGGTQLDDGMAVRTATDVGHAQ